MIILAAILLAAPAADLNPPRVGHEPPTAADLQGNWRLWFEVRDESALFGAALYIEAADGQWTTIEPEQVAPEWFEVIIPVKDGLRYFFEVFDEHGNGPTRVGSAEVPFVLKAPVGELASTRPWNKPNQSAAPKVVTPWWLKPPPRRVVYTALGTAAVTGLAYGSWALLKARPVSKVTLVPVGVSESP